MNEHGPSFCIERYYYSDKQPTRDIVDPSYFRNIDDDGELTPEEKQQVQETFQQLFQLAEKGPDPYRIVLPERIKAFQKMVEPSVKVARALFANLKIYVEDWSGAIFFLCPEMYFEDDLKDYLKQAILSADYIRPDVSINANNNSSLDIDGMPELDIWFDFFKYKD